MASLNRFRWLAAPASLAAALLLGVAVRAGDAAAGDAAGAEETLTAAAAADWKDRGWPLIQQFCLDCHNEDLAEAELDLSGYESMAELKAGGSSMQRVLEMVRFGAMPPEDADVPSEAERKQLVSSIEKSLYAASCDLRPRPGKVTARRLNRAEYNHTIRDLFGLDLRPADAFPSDDVGGGFDNNGDVLSLSPMLVEKYLAAAEEVSQKVLLDPESFARIDEERTGDRLVVVGDQQTGSFFGRFLAEDAFVWGEFELPSDGEYVIKIGAGTTEAPSSEDEKKSDEKKEKKESDDESGDDQPKTKRAAAVYDDTGKLLGIGEFKYYGGGGSAEHEEIRVQLSGGKRRLIVLPLTTDHDAKVGEVNFPRPELLTEDRVAEQRQVLGKSLKPDAQIDGKRFPFMVRRIQVRGPSQPPKEWFPPSQSQILQKLPTRKGKKLVDVKQAATACLTPLMRLAFRGPVEPELVAPYAQLVSDAVERDESFHRGLQIAISAVLVSPRFLFRIEVPDAETDGSASEDRDVALNQFQLATRLSYFLWSSTPDDQLLDLAEQGKLTGEELERQVERMLADDRSFSLATEFASQWFGLRNLREIEPDADRFAGVDDQLLNDMARETELLFIHLVRENGRIDELLSADYSFVNERLAKHYGIDPVEGGDFRKVSLSGHPRRGVLAHASVLTLTSNPTRTSPVKRGKWILENVLGTPPPDPPPGVPELEETKTASADATLREQLELHRENAACASCHRVMDQLGFGLEQFDAVGRFRELDGKQPVDASGELPGGRHFVGAAELSNVLAASEREAFLNTAAARLMTFALGRELSPTDRCTVDEIAERVGSNGGRFFDLVKEIVRSRQFQYYQWSGTEA